jgi:hypothetical protein
MKEDCNGRPSRGHGANTYNEFILTRTKWTRCIAGQSIWTAFIQRFLAVKIFKNKSIVANAILLSFTNAS